jgi:hypothetical protein
VSELLLSLNIETVGAKEALDSLNLLDKKGRQIVDDAAGATGRAMGDVASAYTRGGAAVKSALENIALGHRENIAVMEEAGIAAERLERRQSIGTLSATRGLEQIARTGRVAGRSLDTILSQVSQITFGFGAEGAIVGAISIATAAVVEMMRKAAVESKRLVAEIAADFERIARMDVKGQGEAAGLLYGGDNAATLNKDGTVNLARFSIPSLLAQQKDFLRREAAGTFVDPEAGVSMTKDANEAADALQRVNRELERRNTLLPGITTRGGLITQTGTTEAAQNRPSMVTDALKEAEASRKREQAEWNKEVKAFSVGVEQRKKDLDQLVASAVAKATNADEPGLSMAESVERANKRQDSAGGGLLSRMLADLVPDPKEIEKTIRAVGANVRDALKDDPFEEARKALDKHIKDLSAHISASIGKTLGDSIAAGLEEAFKATGFQNPFAALTSVLLNGLGNLMEQLGAGMILFGGWVAKFVAHVATFDFVGQIEAGIGMIAAGAALKAIAGSFGKSSSSGGGSSGGASAAPTFLTFGVQAAGAPTTGTHAPPSRASFGPNYFIGPDDPKVQRQFAEIVNRADARGLVNR